MSETVGLKLMIFMINISKFQFQCRTAHEAAVAIESKSHGYTNS